MTISIAIISHPDCYKHYMGNGHPECPQRFQAIETALKSSNISALQYHSAPLVTQEQLLRVHPQYYLDQLRDAAPIQEKGLSEITGDTSLNKYSLLAASRAAGAAILAVDLVLTNKVNSAFCPIRPPGHHAKVSRAAGFCFYNNVAIATFHAIEQHHLKRIAIIDFDVHHGNGTENIVARNPKIMLFSSFQHPFYPYEGADSRSQNICNLPLPAFTDGPTYREAITQKWLPRLHEFQPQLIIFSAGFDAHKDDGMASLILDESDYTFITQQIKAIADKHASGRMVSCLEGGYNLKALASSALAHVKAMI